MKVVLRAILPPVVVTTTRPLRRRLAYKFRARSSPDLRLTDGVVALRTIDASDLDLVERAARDPEITRRITLLRTQPHGYFATFWYGAWDGSAFAFAVSEVGGPASGLLTVQFKAGGRADLGYWLLPEARGRGRAALALRLVSEWALSQPGVCRLELSTTPDNVASQRVAERCGYRCEGVLRSYTDNDGRREDAVIFSLLPADLDEGPRASSSQYPAHSRLSQSQTSSARDSAAA